MAKGRRKRRGQSVPSAAVSKKTVPDCSFKDIMEGHHGIPWCEYAVTFPDGTKKKFFRCRTCMELKIRWPQEWVVVETDTFWRHATAEEQEILRREMAEFAKSEFRLTKR